MAGTHDHVIGEALAPSDGGSASRPSKHHLRVGAGRVSLWWDPDQGAFVAAHGQQSWSDARLGALARTVGIKVPAKVARELRRDERLYSGPRLQPAIAPHRTERGGVAQVEPGRRAVVAEWAHEASARRSLIEELDSVMRGLARGDLLDQAMRRLEALADRFGGLAEIEGSPTQGAHLRAHEHTPPTAPAPTPADELHALSSRPALPADVVGMS